MSKHVIRLTLDEKSIDQAITQVKQYESELQSKMEALRKKVAERLGEETRSGFASAIVDDLLPDSGGARSANVTVETRDDGAVSLVIASGADAVWCEFGAGVYHNGAVGSSPNPLGNALGFTIGGFGKGVGRKEVWGFYEGETLRLTHGTPASMPMYNALQRVCAEIGDLAREVFG